MPSTPAHCRAFLNDLKATELKHFAFLTGLNNSGTRASLIASLSDEFSRPSRFPDGRMGGARPRPLRVLSIDMGIRNLAYCVLELPSLAGFRATEGVRSGAEGLDTATWKEAFDAMQVSSPQNQVKLLGALTLVAWRRTGVSAALSTTDTSTSTPTDLNAPLLDTKEAFDPATFAKLAYNLVATVLLPYKVSHIVIERQRYRSGGAPAILEWTVRVNMFESMLHAILEALKRQWAFLRTQESGEYVEGKGKGNVLTDLKVFPTVQSVSPKKVGGFWVEAAEGKTPLSLTKARKGKTRTKGDAATRSANDVDVVQSVTATRKSKIEKEAKIVVAEGWLRGGLRCVDDAEKTRAAFLAKRSKAQKGSKNAIVDEIHVDAVDATSMTEHASGMTALEKIDKLDDLADCLLQGAAWIQWEINRELIIECMNMEVGAERAGKLKKRP